MVSGMSNPISNRVRGELLREWRFSQNWDVVELAKRVNLSIGQIQQLETGGTSLFYSMAIRENAARKVAAMLGADLHSVIRIDDEPATPGPESKVVDDLIELSRQRAQAAQKPLFLAQHASLIAITLLSLAGLVVAAGWLQQKWQNGGAQQFWREAGANAPVTASASAAQPVTPATGQALDSPAQATSALNEAALHKTSPLAATSSADAAAVPAATVPAATVPAVAMPPATALASAAVLVPTPPAASSSAAATATATASAAVATANKHPLCQQASTGHALTPTRPSKARDMVYIVAQKTASVCVVDAAAVHTVLSLKPQL